MSNNILTARENMLRFGMGYSPTETVYVDSRYLVDIKDGSNQVPVEAWIETNIFPNRKLVFEGSMWIETIIKGVISLCLF